MAQKQTKKASDTKAKAKKSARLKESRYSKVWLVFTVLVCAVAGYFLLKSFAAPPAPTIYLSPASQTLGPNTTFTVQVRENSGTAGVNAVQANFSYNASLVDFVSISSSGTAFTTDAPSSGGSGQVSIARGLIGSATGDQLVATVTFKTKTTSGNVNMAFTSGSALVSSSTNQDLLGSLSATGGAAFTVDNTVPTVSVSAPANNAVLSAGSTVSVTASASDSGSGVASVEFYVDGTKVSTDTTSPYSYSWSTTSVALGAHTLQAKAFDVIGNNATSSLVNVTLADQTAPTVSITAPAAGAKLSGTVSINATAADNTGGTGVSKVEFYVDGVLKSTDTSSPYSYSWVSSTSADGTRSLTAKAYDNASPQNSATSTAVSVTVDNTAPTTPGNLRSTSTTTTSITLAWNASTDSGGLSGYRITRNGNVITTTNSTTLTYADSGLAPGTSYTYTVTALDVSGNASVAASLDVSTVAPKPGDVNGDNVVNISDLSILLTNWGTSNSACDINKDGTVSIFDLSILLTNYGT